MKWKNNLTIILIILALVMALIFLDVAVLVALKMQSEAAREPEVYRVIVMTEPETQTEPEAAETAQAPDLPEQDAAAERPGTCLWVSEIEEFPMAVTRKRIGG